MSGASPLAPDRPCLECGASNTAQASVCWLCRRALAAAVAGTATSGPPDIVQAEGGTPFRGPSQPAPSAARHAHLQFGLASLMLTVTLCAVLMGAATILPGLGIGLAILATPAFIHTAVTAVRRQQRGGQMDPIEKLVFFCGSLGAVLVTLAAVGIAFFATCFGGFFAGAAVAEGVGARGDYVGIAWGFWTGSVLGALAGLVVLVLLIRMYVRRYRRRSV